MDTFLKQSVYIQEEALMKRLSQFKSELIHDGLTDITACFTSQTRKFVMAETLRIFKQRAERRDFFDQSGSPRNLFNVTEETIATESPFLDTLYYSQDILQLLQLICGEKIEFVPFPGERYIINGLSNRGDNQGWHWDDYAYAMVFIAKATRKEHGGLLEYVPHIYWDRDKPQIQKTLKHEVIHKKWFPKGHVYLMRSDNTLHRVSTISANKERIAFITAYRNEADLLKNIDHLSTLQLAGRI